MSVSVSVRGGRNYFGIDFIADYYEMVFFVSSRGVVPIGQFSDYLIC